MKLKILKLGWEFPPNNWGGLGVACYGLVKGLINNDVKVTLVLPNSQKSNLKNCNIVSAQTDLITSNKNLIFDKHKTISVKKKIYNNLYSNLHKKISNYAKFCTDFVVTQNFDLIHAHDWMTLKAAVKIKKISGKPLVIHVHSTEIDRQGKDRAKKEIYKIEKIGMQEADCIIAVSNFTKKRIVKYYKIDPKKIKVVHNAISFEDRNFNNNNSIMQDPLLQKKLDKIFSSKNFKVLFLGRLTAQKGPKYFLSAAHKILQHRDDVEFIVAGDGDMKSKLIKKSAELKISKKIIFTGFLRGEQIDKIYKAADVYVMPSVCEPFGLAPLEAMKNGTPVVLSKDAGVCEIIKNCLKVDFWNTGQIKNKVIQLLDSPQLYKKLVEQGKKEVHNFSWNTAAQKCVKIYMEMKQRKEWKNLNACD